MQATNLSSPKSRLAVAFAGGAIVLGVVLTIGFAVLRSGAAQHTHVTRKDAFPTPATPTTKQVEAAKFDYPASSGSLPATVSVTYDDAKDRTRMVLELKDLRPVASGYRLSSPVLKITSEFPGRARKPDVGELSVQCSIALKTSEAGVLAPGAPPGEITADGKVLPVKPAFPTESGYRSKAKSDGIHESLAFRVSTRDLIRIAKASAVSCRFGTVSITLSPAQLADLREFVARMNPNSP